MVRKKRKSSGVPPPDAPVLLPREVVPLSSLRPHPRNYREHPDDQLDHIIASIRDNGVYRALVVARDSTILAGHGVWKALNRMEAPSAEVVRLDLEPEDPRALKVLTGDNEIGHLGEINDRKLSELLKEIHDSTGDLVSGLLGTGFDASMLATLAMVTRPASEIADFNEAAEWTGMPEFTPAAEPVKMVVSFRNEEDRQAFAEKMGLRVNYRGNKWCVWWPDRPRRDLASVRFEG